MALKPYIFVSRPVPAAVERYLREHCQTSIWDGSEKLSRERFFAEIQNIEGLLTSSGPIDAVLFDHAPKLKIVSNISVGYNNFDLDEMKRRGIMGTHTPGVLDDSVADLIMSLMLSAARRVPELDRLVRDGGWLKGADDALFGVDVHHAKLGIIGMGRIGEALAKRAKFGFDMQISYHNRRRNLEVESRFDAAYAPVDQLLAESDFVVVMTPLTPETEGMIGAAQFAKMKRSAIFINASRGKVIDETALIEALRSGTIRAAGLDVFEQEPIGLDNPLVKLPNTVLLPHIGSATAQTRADMAMLAAENLVAGVYGKVPPNLVPELR